MSDELDGYDPDLPVVDWIDWYAELGIELADLHNIAAATLRRVADNPDASDVDRLHALDVLHRHGLD